MFIDAGGTFDKIRHILIIKRLNKWEIEGNHLNIVRATCENSTVNIILNSKVLKSIPVNQEKDKDASLTTSSQHNIGNII